MTKRIPPRRSYNSTRRQAQARETRRQITEAARRLFSRYGYGGTTIDAIAQEAGVAPETVYAAFGSKRKILSHLVDVSVGGDDQPVRLLDRPEPQAVLQIADPQRQIEMFARGITDILVRVAPVFEVVRSAAKTEPDISVLLKHLLEERLENMTTFAAHVAEHGGLREGMDISKAADTVWTMTSPEVFTLLTQDLNYSPDQFVEWLALALKRLLLPS